MKLHELSPEDQKLVQTDLGEFDKIAEEQMAIADEMYTVGFTKLAAETADYLDAMFEKVAEDKKEEKEEELDEESEKKAAELGAFIERGYFDGLRKLGAERHGDELAYLLPFVEEKIAAKGAEGALAKGWKAFKAYHTKGKKQLASGGSALKRAVTGKSEAGRDLGSKSRWGAAKAGLKEVGKGGARFLPHAAVAGGAAYGGKKLYDKNK